MKQGAIVNKIVMLVLMGAIVIYLIASAASSLRDPFSTAISYAYSVDDAVEATGFLVREEMVLSGQGGIADVLPEEGEKVANGEVVALLYESEEALERGQTIRELELERELLEELLEGDDTRDAAALNQAVIDAMVNLRASVTRGDLTGLERQTKELKALIYRRDYTYGGDMMSIESALAAMDSQIAALNTQSRLDTERVTTARAGVFSGEVDGYESLLTPAQIESYTPSSLDRLAGTRPAGEASALGRLITDSTWYFVCPLTEEDADRLYEGGTVTVRFSRDWSGEVDMQVEHIGPPEDGRVSVVLSSDRFLSEVTLLRRQTVDLVFDTLTGIRVPKQALRVVNQPVTDPDTGETRQEPVTGVYALVSRQAEFKPVEVLDQEGDFCLVRPVEATTQTEAKKTLRAGDEIIVTAEGLYDGKVVR